MKILTRKELNTWIIEVIIERTTNKNRINVLNINIYRIEKNRFKFVVIIRDIPENVFIGFINLKELDFVVNQIKEKLIHPNTFYGLANLEVINYSSNKI